MFCWVKIFLRNRSFQYGYASAKTIHEIKHLLVLRNSDFFFIEHISKIN